ncbi:High-affnity carbon uptake protein Hat/HatR [[Actinomadura] parvosata subsp. kistnae]|uniref:Novel STAND NTPase 1 domain-containing protein n=1 Tax=[Actinomadura] parvosata subsp. kistnae TaxID=1909395 RepID=A0A1U9ZUA1_9ACTN|nr:AAA family ATPase [Nonomuraea sp. ATCC 55076]AQZ61522.1 hypothetical protein BKM31_08565 [Nonomuraea sp. ATCC 55076]SPL98234.1 High-affnity carbon uptake protein Hat/HatR [Actinomadura parvosata subsp. kistnae]
MSDERDGADPSASMRGGVARAMRSATARAREWTPPALLAVLSAGAFAPLLVPALGGSALAVAAIGAVTAVGGNLLTDVVRAGLDSLRRAGGEPSRDALENELERRIREALEAGGQDATELRAEIARLLREHGLVGAAIEEAVRTGNRELQVALAEGLSELGAEFTEFAFVLSEVDDRLRSIREGVDQQRAQLQVAVGLQYRQATDTRLLLEQLAVIERRTRRADAPQEAGGPGWSGGSPYKGLATYTEADAGVFAGREVVTSQLAGMLSERLAGPGLVVVTGASGAGKSSLLRAGLFAAIARGDLSGQARHWPRHVLDRPTRSPLSVLASLLAGLAGLDAPTVLAALRRAPQDASLLARQAVDTDARRRELPAEVTAGCRLILVVDQFEEVFADESEEAAAERAAFVTALHAAATVPAGAAGLPPALVLIAVRGDVIDKCADHPELVTALREGPFVLGPMTEPELRAAITVPAHAAGLDVEAGLADTILGELRSSSGTFDAGVLPLLSQTMLTVWEHREDRRLTHRGYAVTGGVTHAVASSAEAAYDSLDPSRRELARRLFQRLTAVSGEARLTRRPATRTALTQLDGGAALDEVLEVFARRRLIVIDAGSVQIAHDALLQRWPRLHGWLEADLAGHALRGQLLEDAEDWERNGRDPSYLYRGERLAAVLHARTRWQDGPLAGAPRLFLDAAVRADTRGRRQRRLTLAALSALFLAALVLANVALVQGGAARQQATLAQERLRVALARQLVAKAEAALGSDPRTALMLMVAAHRVHGDAETYSSLQEAITTTPYAGQLTGVRDQVHSLDYSADGRHLAAGFTNGTIMLWDVRDPLRPRQAGAPFIAFESPATVTFSADGGRLVTVGSGGEVVIWDLRDPARPRKLGTPVAGKRYRQGGAWVSPDGAVLATSWKDQPRLQLWDLREPGRIRRLGRAIDVNGGEVSALAFSADGATIAAGGGGEKPVTLWDVGGRKAPRLLGRIPPPHRDLVDNLAFSPDGRMLAVSGTLRGIALWNVSDPAEPRAARDVVRVALGSRVRFSPRGATLATTGGRDTGLLLWDVTYPDFPNRTERLVAGRNDTTMTFSPDGGMVASGSEDGHVTLWNLDRAGRPRAFGRPFVGHQEGRYPDIYGLAMSADATMVATSGRDSTVEVWDIADRARPRRLAVLKGHTGEGIEGVAFAPDGRILATGGVDQNVFLWDLTDCARPRRLRTALTGPTNIIRSLLFTDGGRTLIVAGDQATIFWDVRDPARPRQIAHVLDEEGVLAIRQVRDGRVLAVVRGSGTYATPAVAQPAVSPTQTGGSNGAAEARPGRPTDGPGDPDGARLWDLTDPHHPRRVGPALVGHAAEVQSAALSPAGDLLVTGDRDGVAILWDAGDPARLRRLGDPLTPHGSLMSINMAFAPSTDIMATGGIDGNAYLWDLGNRILPRRLGTALADNLDTVGHLVFDREGELLATAGARGDVVLWDLRPTYALRAHLDETVCLVTGGGLDRDQWGRYLQALPYRDTCPP